MKKFTLLFLLSLSLSLSLSSFSYSQVSQQWVVRFNGTGNTYDAVNKSKVDPFGNIYISGYSNGPGGNIDFCVLKYNSSGALLWSRTYDGPNHLIDDAYAMTVDNFGNVFLSGRSDSNGLSGMITIKYSQDGDFLWVKDFGGLIITDTNGNLCICGESTNQQDQHRLTVKKYNSSGAQLWENNNSSEGSYALELAIDQSGNLLITGEISRESSSEIATWKYNPMGNLLWEAHYQYSPVAYYRGVCIKTDVSGNIYVAGESTSLGITACDFVTLKFNAAGEQQWVAIYSGSFYNSQYIRGMAIDGEQNIYITGESNSDYATIKYNTNGEQQWCVFYNGEANERDEVYGIDVDAAGNVYVTGWSMAAEGMDCVTIKYNTYGVQQWKQSYHGSAPGTNCTNSIIADFSGSVYVAGFSEGEGSAADILLIKYGQTTEVSPVSNQIPSKYFLSQNYPNPFNPVTAIEFSLPENTFVTLKIFDITGREIYVLVNENLSSGVYIFNLNGVSLASGTYFYKLETEKFSETKKMLLLK